MDTVLVDTSVWVNFFKNIETKATLFLDSNFTHIKIATCPVIIQEILQGILSDKEERIVDHYFNKLIKLTEDPYLMAIDAAAIYRGLRKKGITIRKPNDCLIAAYAIKNGVRLLHDDRDFNYIAQNSNLII